MRHMRDVELSTSSSRGTEKRGTDHASPSWPTSAIDSSCADSAASRGGRATRAKVERRVRSLSSVSLESGPGDSDRGTPRPRLDDQDSVHSAAALIDQEVQTPADPLEEVEMSYEDGYIEGPSSILVDDQLHPPTHELDIVSVHDHEAFAHKHLADLGQETEDVQVYTWRIKNYRSQSKRMTSPDFECGGHKWNILLFPTGNSNGQANDMVSVYLNYGDPKHAKEGWHVCAQFALAISNPEDGTCFIQSQAHHRFNQDEQDWGFTRFVELRKLYNPADQRAKAVIQNDETDITAFVRVLKDPTGVLWHNFQNYDSKKETGYVGLKNQGATCYMNSLLQSLFLTNTYRKAVYQIPTENENLDSVPLALQRVFYLLQTGELSVGTTELTKSFGWKGFDSFLQHDVQEFNRVLQDKLEVKMKGTPAEGALNRLFLGKFKSFLRCINVEYESARTEDFMDLQLGVQNLKNLEAAFRDFVEVEVMDGDNKWKTDEYGMQDAKKGLIFEAFPPVLHLQLKRFQYDPERDANVKINDRFEYPFEIDLEPFMAEDADRSESWIYQLHGVLVHSGDVHGGHYFVLIKPSANGRWLRFDDDRVVHVTDKEVLEDNFGGNEPAIGVDPRQPKQGVIKRFTNAYMLVYVRKTRVDEVMAPLKETDTPEHLRARLDKERKEAEQKRRDREEMHLYLTVKVITDESFRQHQGFDLATFDDRTMPESELYTKRVLKAQTFQEFKAHLLEDLQVPQGDARLWVLVNRQNKTVRPDAPVPDNDPTLTMEVVRDRMASRQQDLKLYLEFRKSGEAKRWLEAYPTEQPIMVFVKHFDVEEQSLAGIGHFYVHRHLKVIDLANMINDYMKYPAGTPLKIYEEIKPNMIELMKAKATFLQSEIQDGDIVCFQTELSEQSLDLDKNKLKDPPAFYDYFLNRLNVNFKPKPPSDNPKALDFDLMLSKKMTYDQMAMRVGDYLKHDFAKLRFWSSNSQTQQPKNVIRRTASHSVAEMVAQNFAHSQLSLLYYELLDIPLVELETKKQVRVTWMGLHNKDEGSHSFLQPKTSTINDVADALSRVVKMGDGGSARIRLFSNDQARRIKMFHGGEVIREADTSDLYAEEIPVEELNADETRDKIIGAFHFSREVAKTHGVPFRFVVKQGERFDDTKKRLQVRMGVADKELAKMKFSIVMSSFYKQPSYVKDDDILWEHKWREDDMLGIDHLDRTTKRVNPERALVIR